MPRAGARGCAPQRAYENYAHLLGCLNAPCWGARVCTPQFVVLSVEAKRRLNAPCWGARVCTEISTNPGIAAVQGSQCPVLGREGVHRDLMEIWIVGFGTGLNAPCWGARVCTPQISN